ncbi:hypothetical protein Tco_0795521 [Tanacetum coccineum]
MTTNRISSNLDISCQNLGGDVVDLTGDEDLTDEDGDIGMGDSTGVSTSLGGEIFSGGKKSWESTSMEVIEEEVGDEAVCKKEKDSDMMLIELIKNNDCPSDEELDEDNDVLGEEELGG